MKKPGMLALLLSRELAPAVLGGIAMVALGLYPILTQDQAEMPLRAVMFSSVVADRAVLLMGVAMLVAGLSSLGIAIARARGLSDLDPRYPDGHPG
jgi:drug/metabolite transporter (DMT)-like permease